MLFATTWGADIFAYAAGNLLKGPKLWPRFSPNKTWSGFVFGLFGAMLAGTLVHLFWSREGAPGAGLSPWVGLAAGLATMAGDLWESMLKRRFGVKDSGDLIRVDVRRGGRGRRPIGCRAPDRRAAVRH